MSVRNETGGLPNNTGSQIDGLSSNGEKNDGAILGQSLINFMTLATGSVKTALQKPANYKKNINHRRYLQKQLKICSRRKKRSTKAKTGPKNKKAVNKQVLGTASDVWLRQANCADIFVASEGSCSQEFPTNNLFFPYETSFSTSASGYSVQSSLTQSANFQNGYTRSDFIYSEQEQANFSPTQSMDNGSAFFRDDSLPIMLDEEAEQFLTGEELTQVLDIKDLFVPGRTQESENDNELMFRSNFTFDENLYSCFQTVPSATSILSW